MGRPYISLQPLASRTALSRPFAWKTVFPGSRRLHVEIGFGLGDFLVRQALAHPCWGIVGIETGWMSIRRTLRKIALAKVPNVRLLRLDARVALERYFDKDSVTSLDSLFPCPWPKQRHFRYRLFSGDFFRLLNTRIVSGGMIRIVTDHEGYSDWMADQAKGTGFLLRRRTIPPMFGTKYERKWQDQGQTHFYEMRLVKENDQSVPLKEDIPLKTRMLLKFDPAAFRPTGCRGKIVVAFKDYLFDPVRGHAMQRTLVIEDNFKQDFWIEICRLDGTWHIRPAKGCTLLPTVGVQQALDLVWESARRQSR